jgi:nucleoside-diphosphate-sugar epimerase
MRVMVTGATGFLGRHAVSALQSTGHHVIAVVRKGNSSSAQELVEADLLTPGAAAYVARNARADALLHLAWTTEHGVFWTDPGNLKWLSVTLELVEAMVANGTQRICAVGTCFEYDWPLDGNCIESETGIRSHTLYDTAKDSCRRVLTRFAFDKEFSFAWARLFHLFGSAEHPDRLVSSLCRSLIAGQPAECSSGKVLRDFMDARDAGAALAALAVSKITGPINIASGKVTRLRDIATALGELAGRSDLVRIGARPDRENDPPRITADVQRLEREVRFIQNRPLESGLADALDFWRARATDQ